MDRGACQGGGPDAGDEQRERVPTRAGVEGAELGDLTVTTAKPFLPLGVR